jgi:hypothetical protein
VAGTVPLVFGRRRKSLARLQVPSEHKLDALPITANKNCNLAVLGVPFRQYTQAMKIAILR